MSDDDRAGGGSDGEERPLARVDRAEEDHADDSDSSAGEGDEEDEDHGPQGGPARVRGLRAGAGAAGRPPGARLALHDFLRLIAGHVGERAHAASNEELVDHLSRSGMITSSAVRAAMLVCPRALFVPEGYRDEAYLDAPIRVEAEGFNISAPHMHATGLEALAIQEGDSVLDVGCGCGLVAAAAAMLAGKAGRVVALDVRPACIAMTQRNIAALAAGNPSYADAACGVAVEARNVFVPSARHAGAYDKVHVGAMCPEARLQDMIRLLKPGGGRILAPVDSDLRLVTVAPDGRVTQRVISQVRFSELEVPRDADIVVSMLEEEDAAAGHVTVPPPTWATDLAHLAKRQQQPGGSGAACSCAHVDASPAGPSDHEADMQTGTPATTSGIADPMDVGGSPGGGGDGGAAGSSGGDQEGSFKRHKSGPHGTEALQGYLGDAAARLALGVPDCELQGSSPGGEEGGEAVWRLPAHHAVLQARCDLFRARSTSGMRDAGAAVLAAPEGVSAAGVAALLRHVYCDDGVEGLPVEQLAEVVHVATFFGVPRLMALCEYKLAALLESPAPAPAPAAAAAAAPSAAAVRTARGLAAPAAAAASTSSVNPDTELGSASAAGTQHDGEAATEAAAQLLALAEEAGLPQLRAVATRYISEHYEAVSQTEAYRVLPRHLVDEVAAHCAARTRKVMDLLRQLSCPSAALPNPTYG